MYSFSLNQISNKKFINLGRCIILFSVFLISKASAAELPQLSRNSIVSVITCSPTSAYEGAFGHSAIRIQDDSLKIDVIFNYGMYNSDQSFFLYRVLLGKLTSSLEGEAFYKFAERYRAEGRGVREFYLNLTQPERQRLWIALNNEIQSNNRFYSFNVTVNNCTTHVRDVLFEQLKLNAPFYKSSYPGYTFRDFELQSPMQNCWFHLLFNLIVGANADAKCSVYQSAFSPDGLILLLKAINENERALVVAEHELFPPEQLIKAPDKVISVSIFSILLFFCVILLYIQYRKNRSFVWFDRILFLLSGFIGLFFLSLMLFSEIPVLKINYNIMWALPTNIVLAFLIKKKNTGKWAVGWARVTFGCTVSFLLFSFFFGQYIPAEAYLLALALLVRLYVYTLKLK